MVGMSVRSAFSQMTCADCRQVGYISKGEARTYGNAVRVLLADALGLALALLCADAGG
jgi:hypothetical protein